ncbi:MAG: hypothetical protein ABII71_06375 [Candidatus Micrarchaeota archaeon]
MFDVAEMFFHIVTPQMFDVISALLIITFIQWELPRTVKLLDEEYTNDVYPETGRVIDIILFLIGIGAMFVLYQGNNMAKMITLLHNTYLMLIFIPVMIVIPLMIFLGYFKRFFARMDQHKSLTVFMVQSTLDFGHTLFFVSLVLLLVPALLFLVLAGF